MAPTLLEHFLTQAVSMLPIWILGALFILLLPRQAIQELLKNFVQWVVAVWKLVLFSAKFFQLQKDENDASRREEAAGSSVELLREDSPEIDWHITKQDLEFFLTRSRESVDGQNPWEVLMEKKVAGKLKYWAKRRRQAGGKTEYLSSSVISGVSAEEAMDFYLYDTYRPKWDGLIRHVEVIEQGDHDKRCQVVRWLRTFPFVFLNDREYIIARRRFVGKNGELYGITKTIDHPRAPARGNVVRMQQFFSMWKIRNVSNPWNSRQECCEILLLHFEDFGIPEHLARFAVKVGMWGFIKSMLPAMQRFSQERRMRVDPRQEDFATFGSGISSRGLMGTSMSSSSLTSMDSRDSQRSRKQGFKRVASAVLIAGGVAVASNLVKRKELHHAHHPHGKFTKKSFGSFNLEQNQQGKN
eukprot:TRINITY_DN9993_c1_g1_i1.p1 TRINITY_DN9993_c1_g1~~TRINITY_DN9993_c1_g1_i1.p1  ORF type:complete len:430 (-),score=42.34 TRINITY_DN9993_c1_g1_i1:527-1765(-)